MDRSTRITQIINQRKPLAQRIEVVEGNLGKLSTKIRQLEDYRHHLIQQVDEPTIIGKLREIDFSGIHLSITKELDALTKLKNRFSRDTLNIGVVGLARQGKSRLLQSLMGLSNVEIPDGDRYFLQV